MNENLNITKTIRVPLETVWHAISNIDGLDRWFPVINHCLVQGQGIGAIRTLTLIDGGVIRDKIEEINHEKHQFCYQCLSLPFPVSQYQGTVNLTSSKPGETSLTWSADYQVSIDKKSEMSAFLQNVITDGIIGLEQDLRK